MKTAIFCLLAFSTLAEARDKVGALSCNNSGDTRATDEGSLSAEITLEAETRFSPANDRREKPMASLYNVTMTWKDLLLESLETGRRGYIESNPNYKPTRYKNHFQFDMMKLVDTKNFTDYAPGDECYAKLLLPNTAWNKKGEIGAVLQVSCENGGGNIQLRCTIDPKND